MRHKRSWQNWEEHCYLKQAATQLLADRLLDIPKKFNCAVDLGCHNGEMAQAMSKVGRMPKQLLSCDSYAQRLHELPNPKCVCEDELLPLATGQFDLITNACNLHHVTDLPGALTQIRMALCSGGLFLGCMVGGDSLSTLRNCLQEAELEVMGGVSPRVAPMVDIRDLGGLLQRAGFALPVVDIEEIEFTHANLFDLMADLRNMGETNCLEARIKHPTRRTVFLRAAELYQTRAATQDNRVRTPIQLLLMHGWNENKA